MDKEKALEKRSKIKRENAKIQKEKRDKLKEARNLSTANQPGTSELTIKEVMQP